MDTGLETETKEKGASQKRAESSLTLSSPGKVMGP